MYYYKIAEIILKSEYRLLSFNAFACNECEADIKLKKSDESPPSGKDFISGSIVHRRLRDGWFFHCKWTDCFGLYVSEDYTCLRVLGVSNDTLFGEMEWFVRIAMECKLAYHGYVSLHAAAVEIDGEAFAFTGPSGIGKSTRAFALIDGLDAKLINGDRPLINVKYGELYGVPWDGKEQCFRNVHFPLKVICEVRRSEMVYARKMSFAQRRRVLIQQCFIPMWDTETATIQMTNIAKLAAKIEMVRIFCGPSADDAKSLLYFLQNNILCDEQTDMKAKQGFALQNVEDEYMLVPTSDNIRRFGGLVLRNEVSAFVWKKMQDPISKADLLQAVLEKYEVERAIADADLDTLLTTFRKYDVIEDE